MSKENTNLRLLGSPVNLSYRSKKKDDKKNIRNRPRSALQSSCVTPENPDRFKRPFSADTKERAGTTRSFLKSFSADLLQSYNNASNNLKIVPPTTVLLGDTKPYENLKVKGNKETCSNASDYGSEDTFISLGTKIKTKAQTPKKNTNTKALKYRNIAKKGRKMEQPTDDDKGSEHYGLEVTIKERAKSQSPCRDIDAFFHRSASPSFKKRAFESYFVPLEDIKTNYNNLNERQSLDNNNPLDIEKTDTYSRRLPLTKQQLSLVEEESIQDLESIPSNNLPSLSPETSLNDKHRNPNKQDFTVLNVKNHTEKGEEYTRNIQNFSNESKTYRSFYDDFNNHDNPFRNNFSSTVIHTDSSSKDSGYPESVMKDDKTCVQNYSLPPATILRKANSDNNLHNQPKSLDSASSEGHEKNYQNTYPPEKKWAETLNHSRLLYKDFFLKKEGHLAVPPQNSPDRPGLINKKSEASYANTNLNDENVEREISEYPKYLLNSSTKAYTSKVIEDYKREIEAINNLHELTLKDIKTETISPTPLHIETMYEQSNNNYDDKHNSIESSQNSYETNDSPVEDKTSNQTDISKVTTRELINNYFKIKHDYPKGTKENVLKNLKKFEKKLNNLKSDNKSSKIDWKINKSNIRPGQEAVKHQSPKNIFTTKIPLSSRIESVQNDKDVESWISLTVPTPRTMDAIDNTEVINEIPKEHPRTETPEVTKTEEKPTTNVTPREEIKAKELDSKATVLDIYSMLKEIESYGDNPVTTVTNVEVSLEELPKEENGASTPKDNFMEIFEFLEKVEQSANDALSLVTNSAPQNTPKLEVLLKLPHTELAQRVVTSALQLEERSCCIALLQESLANHKQQMITKVSNLEKQSQRNIMKVKQECDETIKRHQNFIDQLINDKKTLNHRIEQLVDERRSLEERWKRSVQTLEERYKLELRNQHDKMAAAQQVARQRWVRQKAEKIKELTVKGLEGELREMAERQQKELSDVKMAHAEQLGKTQAKHAADLEMLRRTLEEEKEDALVKERQLASSRLEKQMLEVELTYQEQRTRLVAELRAEGERAATHLADRERQQREDIEKWKEEQENLLQKKREELDKEIAKEKSRIEELLKQKRIELEEEFERYKKEFEAEQQIVLKKKVTDISAQHKLERDKEIEKAIESMEAEAQAGRRELQEALRRNKEQYETELKELGETEQATLRRYQEAQARVRHTEDRCAELEVTIGQLEARNKVLTEKNIQVDTQAEAVRASCEAAWRARLDALTRDAEDTRNKHDEQMHQLYAKVKVAVAKKDSTIQALTRETAKYQEKITLLEQKLQQQRKDFLKQK